MKALIILVLLLALQLYASNIILNNTSTTGSIELSVETAIKNITVSTDGGIFSAEDDGGSPHAIRYTDNGYIWVWQISGTWTYNPVKIDVNTKAVTGVTGARGGGHDEMLIAKDHIWCTDGVFGDYSRIHKDSLDLVICEGDSLKPSGNGGGIYVPSVDKIFWGSLEGLTIMDISDPYNPTWDYVNIKDNVPGKSPNTFHTLQTDNTYIYTSYSNAGGEYGGIKIKADDYEKDGVEGWLINDYASLETNFTDDSFIYDGYWYLGCDPNVTKTTLIKVDTSDLSEVARTENFPADSGIYSVYCHNGLIFVCVTRGTTAPGQIRIFNTELRLLYIYDTTYWRVNEIIASDDNIYWVTYFYGGDGLIVEKLIINKQ